jgi:hypothetical protein
MTIVISVNNFVPSPHEYKHYYALMDSIHQQGYKVTGSRALGFDNEDTFTHPHCNVTYVVRRTPEGVTVWKG